MNRARIASMPLSRYLLYSLHCMRFVWLMCIWIVPHTYTHTHVHSHMVAEVRKKWFAEYHGLLYGAHGVLRLSRSANMQQRNDYLLNEQSKGKRNESRKRRHQRTKNHHHHQHNPTTESEKEITHRVPLQWALFIEALSSLPQQKDRFFPLCVRSGVALFLPIEHFTYTCRHALRWP